MKHVLLFSLGLILFTSSSVLGQIKSVYYNVPQGQINEGNPLPSEEPFYIKGRLPGGIEMVTAKIYRSSKTSLQAEEYYWKKPFDFAVSEYEIFIAEPLRSNENYTVAFYFYERADQGQMDDLKSSISSNLESYIRANMEVSRGKIRSLNSDKVMMTQLKQIVQEGTKNYQHFIGQEFEGFSDVVRQKLKQKDELKLRRARFNIIGKKKDSRDNNRALYASKYIEELILLLQSEAKQYMAGQMLSLVDIRNIRAYPTEKKRSTLPLNFGYGGFAIKREFGETEYFNGPFAGVSVPLGNKTFTKFLGNASFSAGVFLQNFDSSEGIELSGPFIGLPFYAGLGYKLFRVFRFNAGAVAINSEILNESEKNFHIQPFIGFSLEFDLWLGIHDK
ncbi:hypothetical protein QWY93_02255 [Echinicola jeungdonensis]|uniref:Uncharacterized protein n=1 Tax=Echinicola jeungdonensis TaxID=709343 RepID=A0ABV5J2P8_9BACT|nr:hypothetical protein [Echinicola jeungdonensis]MDN3668156.1 hypothetical protein [Echinicola jeungdonensis]